MVTYPFSDNLFKAAKRAGLTSRNAFVVLAVRRLLDEQAGDTRDVIVIKRAIEKEVG